MKYVYTLILLLFGNGLLQAQIPNASFENWTAGNPDGWIVANSPNTPFATQSSISHAGNSALKLEIVSVQGFPVGSPLASGSQASNGYFPVSSREDAVHGWIQTTFVAGDKLHINLAATQAGAPVGAGQLEITANNSNWTPFAVTITYQNGTVVPDSLGMTFTIRGQANPNGYHIGSFVILDDLSYGTATAITHPAAETGWTVSPNPFKGAVRLHSSQLTQLATVLHLYDMQGRLLKTWQHPAGFSSEEISLENCSTGIYLLEIVEGEQVTRLRLVQE